MSLMDATNKAKQMCGCTSCGGHRKGECLMLGVLPHILRADLDSLRHQQMELELTRSSPRGRDNSGVFIALLLLVLLVGWVAA